MADAEYLDRLARDLRLQARVWEEDSKQYTAISTSDAPQSTEVWLHLQTLGSGGRDSVALQKKTSGEDRSPQLRAVKCLTLPQAYTDSDVASYVRGVGASIKMSHTEQSDLFVHSMGWYIDCGQIYIAMEYCEFGDLETYLHQSGLCPMSSLPEDQARQIASQLLTALATMHTEQIYHGSISPSNILIKSQHPDPWKIKLTNFGYRQSQGIPQSSGDIVPPELVASRSTEPGQKAIEVDRYAVDMWCFGETLFQMLCGRTAFSSHAETIGCETSCRDYLEPDLISMSVSDEAISLICELLVAEPTKRATARDAIKHSWNCVESTDNDTSFQTRTASPSMSLLYEWSHIVLSNLPTTEEPEASVAASRRDIPSTQNQAMRAQSRYLIDSIAEQLRTVASSEGVLIEGSHEGIASRQVSWISQASSRPLSEIQDQISHVGRPRAESLDFSIKNEPIQLHTRSKTFWNITTPTPTEKPRLKQRIHDLWTEREIKRLYRNVMRWRTQPLSKKEEANLVGSMGDLVRILLRADMSEAAAQLCRETINIREQKYGSKDQVMAHTMDHLATIHMDRKKWSSAAEILAYSLNVKKHHLHKESNLAWGATHIVDSLINGSQWEYSERTCRQLIEIGELLLYKLSGTATLEKCGFDTSTEGYREAEQIFQAALKLNKAAFGVKHEILPDIMDRIALCMSVQDQFNEAERLYLLTLRLKDAKFGRSDPGTLRTMEGLATMLRSYQKLTAADAFFGYLIELRRDTLGEKHPRTLFSMHDRAETLFQQKRFADAEMSFKEVLRLRREVLGNEHWDTLNSLHQLGMSLFHQSRYAEAETILHIAGELRCKTLGENHPQTLQSRQCFALASNKQKRGSKAKFLM